MNKIQVIGLAGAARVGKDTFVNLAIKILAERGLIAKRFALADALKADINDFLIEKFQIPAFTIDSHSKTLIRPMLVAYGKVKRMQSNGTYWTNLLSESIKQAAADGIIPIITDIRYDEYEKDEFYWIKGLGGKLVFIDRYENSNYGDRVDIGPANQDEKVNNEKLRAKADFKIEWPTYGDDKLDELRPFVENIINQIYA